jgi:hypothetical protein
VINTLLNCNIYKTLCRIVHFFLDNLGQPLYVVSLAHNIGNFVEGINCLLVLTFNVQCGEVSVNKKQIFRCQIV